MRKILAIIFLFGLVVLTGHWIKTRWVPKTEIVSSHHILLEKIEAIGKLELVKYRFSDVIEHTHKTDFLPDASVLLIVKADAVGCIDLTKLNESDIYAEGDSIHIKLPAPEICYIKIDHKHSKVYDTKLAFFREATLVDEAYKYAEQELAKQVRQSDILQQTRQNALPLLKPIFEGLGYKKIKITF